MKIKIEDNFRSPYILFLCVQFESSFWDPNGSDRPRFDEKGVYTLCFGGLSFRTTEESLRNAFQNFGQLGDVNLVMDKIAKRPRGFAFIRYETEEEAQKAIEGMHGKLFLQRDLWCPDLPKKSWTCVL
ncbi:hypothetical protein Peur_069207 [Populus x canadensis]